MLAHVHDAVPSERKEAIIHMLVTSNSYLFLPLRKSHVWWRLHICAVTPFTAFTAFPAFKAAFTGFRAEFTAFTVFSAPEVYSI